MLKRFVVAVILILSAIFLLSCSGTTNIASFYQSSGSQNSKGQVVEFVPRRVYIDRMDVPGDAEHVMAAIINMMRGGRGKLPNIGFDPEGEHQFLDDRFSFAGFDVKFIDISYYKTEPAVDHVRYALLEGAFYFADNIGRSAYIRFMANYVVSKKDIIITNTQYEILPNPNPELRTFILPAPVFESASIDVKNSFKKLYLFSAKNAIDMNPSPKEKARREQYEQLSFLQRMKYESGLVPEGYCVLVFCMDRLRPESQISLSVSESERASNSGRSNPYYRNDSGWVVGLVAGKFSIDAYDKEVFFHVQYNPGIDPENKKMKPVARFSSVKNYHADRVKTPPNPYIEEFQKQGVALNIPLQGTVSAGKVFLNPASVKDAKMIQKRLAFLGFYTMKVDGAFGKGSRRSLQAFKKANGLGNNSKWDMDTQKALFKNSGF